jgi:hypothetical protein
LPRYLRPYVPPPFEVGADLATVRRWIQGSQRLGITCLAGSTARLARFLARLRTDSGQHNLSDLLPNLAGILYSRGPSDPEVAAIRRGAQHGPVVWLEAFVKPAAPIALEDPRHGCLRLLADHGVFLEFVPVEEVGKTKPVRHGLDRLEPGVPYALAVSAPAGLWACLLDEYVRFESRDPWLLHRLEKPQTHRQNVRKDSRPSRPAGRRRESESERGQPSAKAAAALPSDLAYFEERVRSLGVRG